MQNYTVDNPQFIKLYWCIVQLDCNYLLACLQLCVDLLHSLYIVYCRVRAPPKLWLSTSTLNEPSAAATNTVPLTSSEYDDTIIRILIWEYHGGYPHCIINHWLYNIICKISRFSQSIAHLSEGWCQKPTRAAVLNCTHHNVGCGWWPEFEPKVTVTIQLTMNWKCPVLVQQLHFNFGTL